MVNIRQTLINYYGGKWRIAPWIISCFPPHDAYVELCGGAASVLLQKERAALETYNDVDGNVVALFRQIRDDVEALIYQLNNTPYARAEYDECLAIVKSNAPVSQLERARAFFTAATMSITGVAASNPGIKFRRKPQEGSNAELFFKQVQNLEAIAARLRGVQIEMMDALRLAATNNHAGVLLYFDPPYVAETRAQRDRYLCEVDEDFHKVAARVLRAHEGYAVVSGYACALYTELYEAHGWEREDKRTTMTSGAPATESLWLSPATQDALRELGRQERLL